MEYKNGVAARREGILKTQFSTSKIRWAETRNCPLVEIRPVVCLYFATFTATLNLGSFEKTIYPRGYCA